MPAIAAQTLFDESKCYECYGPFTTAQLLELALLRRQLLAANASADVLAQSLYEYAKCYACYTGSAFDLLKLALLDQIAQA